MESLLEMGVRKMSVRLNRSRDWPSLQDELAVESLVNLRVTRHRYLVTKKGPIKVYHVCWQLTSQNFREASWKPFQNAIGIINLYEGMERGKVRHEPDDEQDRIRPP